MGVGTDDERGWFYVARRPMSLHRKEPATLSPSRSVQALDVVGVTLAMIFVGWDLVVGAATGRDPRPMASLVVLCGVTAFVARSVTRRWNTLVPGTLLVVLIGTIVVTWPEAVHPRFGLTGYSNANGALYVVGVGMAGLVVMRSRSPSVRLAAVIAGSLLVLLPWLFSANMASASAVVVAVVTAWLVVARDRALPSVLMHSVLLVAVVVLATGLAGLFYGGDGRGDGGWRLTERRLVLWSESVEMLVDQPVTGVGPGGFAELSSTALRDPDARWAHNTPLQVGAETGLPGLLLFLGLLGWAFVWLARGSGRRGGALASLVLALSAAHASIDFVWHLPAVPVALAALIGAGASAGRLPHSQLGTRSS